MKPHETLGVPPDATREQVRAAFRKLAAQHHPDRADGDTAKFIAINAAHDAMMNKFSTQGVFDDIFTNFAKEFKRAAG